MLEALITSKTRIKLMLKFFMNANSTGYLRGLEAEFGESTNAIRQELNRFEEAGLLVSDQKANRKVFRANVQHPLFPDIQSLVRKYVGMDKIIERVINNLGRPEEVYLIGDLAVGKDSNEINLLIIGNDIDLDYLETLVEKTRQLVSRTIHYAVFTPQEFRLQLPHLNRQKMLKVWENNH